MNIRIEAPASDRLGTRPETLGIAVGQPAPDAAVHDDEGRLVRLSDLYRQGPTLLVFYRGGWCPYCNVQVRQLTEAFPEFQKRGFRPVMISVDRIDSAAKTKAQYRIPFPVLSDPDLVAHEAFRVVHQAGPEEVAKLKGFGLDIEAASGRDHHRFAVPSVFAIDASGTVRWAHVDPDYKVRPSTAQLLDVLDRLSPSAGGR